MFKKWATDETDLSYEHGYLAPIEGKIPRFFAWIGMTAGIAPKKTNFRLKFRPLLRELSYNCFKD